MPPDEYAGEPVWSPDGTQVTFAFTPKAPPSELPVSDIWAAAPGSKGVFEIVKHGANETLRDPAWSSDGRYLYFTVEQSDPNSTNFNSLGVPEGGVRIDRLDTQPGVRSEWISGGEMPGSGGASGRMLYVEDAPDNSTDPSQAQAPGQQLVNVNADGSGKKVLVDSKSFVAMDYPTISPDGKWVAFAAIYLPRTGGNRQGFDLFAWLGLRPESASAHGLPWDMFLVSMQGGTPIKLSTTSDDQPHPTWLSDSVLAYLGNLSMYKVEIDSSGKPLQAPQEMHPGISHGGLTWHGP
jgi:Tol biopolymer transport system component